MQRGYIIYIIRLEGDSSIDNGSIVCYSMRIGGDIDGNTDRYHYYTLPRM